MHNYNSQSDETLTVCEQIIWQVSFKRHLACVLQNQLKINLQFIKQIRQLKGAGNQHILPDQPLKLLLTDHMKQIEVACIVQPVETCSYRRATRLLLLFIVISSIINDQHQLNLQQLRSQLFCNHQGHPILVYNQLSS